MEEYIGDLIEMALNEVNLKKNTAFEKKWAKKPKAVEKILCKNNNKKRKGH